MRSSTAWACLCAHLLYLGFGSQPLHDTSGHSCRHIPFLSRDVSKVNSVVHYNFTQVWSCTKNDSSEIDIAKKEWPWHLFGLGKRCSFWDSGVWAMWPYKKGNKEWSIYVGDSEDSSCFSFPLLPPSLFSWLLCYIWMILVQMQKLMIFKHIVLKFCIQFVSVYNIYETNLASYYRNNAKIYTFKHEQGTHEKPDLEYDLASWPLSVLVCTKMIWRHLASIGVTLQDSGSIFHLWEPDLIITLISRISEMTDSVSVCFVTLRHVQNPARDKWRQSVKLKSFVTCTCVCICV